MMSTLWITRVVILWMNIALLYRHINAQLDTPSYLCEGVNTDFAQCFVTNPMNITFFCYPGDLVSVFQISIYKALDAIGDACSSVLLSDEDCRRADLPNLNCTVNENYMCEREVEIPPSSNCSSDIYTGMNFITGVYRCDPSFLPDPSINKAYSTYICQERQIIARLVNVNSFPDGQIDQFIGDTDCRVEGIIEAGFEAEVSLLIMDKAGQIFGNQEIVVEFNNTERTLTLPAQTLKIPCNPLEDQIVKIYYRTTNPSTLVRFIFQVRVNWNSDFNFYFGPESAFTTTTTSTTTTTTTTTTTPSTTTTTTSTTTTSPVGPPPSGSSIFTMPPPTSFPSNVTNSTMGNSTTTTTTASTGTATVSSTTAGSTTSTTTKSTDSTTTTTTLPFTPSAGPQTTQPPEEVKKKGLDLTAIVLIAVGVLLAAVLATCIGLIIHRWCQGYYTGGSAVAEPVYAATYQQRKSINLSEADSEKYLYVKDVCVDDNQQAVFVIGKKPRTAMV